MTPSAPGHRTDSAASSAHYCLASDQLHGSESLAHIAKRMDHVEPVLGHPAAGVRVVGLGPDVHDTIAGGARERTDRPVGNDGADEVAVVAAEYDFIAELGTVAGLDETVSDRNCGVLEFGIDGSRCRHERPDPSSDGEGDDVSMDFAVQAVTQ